MSYVVALQVVTMLANLCLGLFVLYKNHRSRVNLYFFLFTMGIVGWTFSLIVLLAGAGSTLLWGKLAFSFATIVAVGLALFSTVFPRNISKSRFREKILLATGIIFLFAPNLMISSVDVVDSRYIMGELSPGPYLIYIVYYMFVLVYAFYRMIRNSIYQKGIKKMQLAFAITGTALFLAPSVMTQLILPMFGNFQYNGLGPAFTLPMVAFIGYAIVRYRLMDVRVVIQRGVIYTMLSVLIVLIYMVLLQIVGNFLGNSTDMTVATSGLLATIIGVWSAPALETKFRKATDGFFFKDDYIFSNALHEMGSILNKNIDIEDMIGQLIRGLEDTMKIKDARMVLVPKKNKTSNEKYKIYRYYSYNTALKARNDAPILIMSETQYIVKNKKLSKEDKARLLGLDKYAKNNNIEVIVPIVLDKELLGLLLLGDKLSGNPYTSRDIDFLNILSRQTAVSLKKAELYDKVKEYSLELEKKVEERTEKIRSMQKYQEEMILEISHSLQTPLSIMKLELEMLKRDMPNNETFPVLERSIDEASKFIYDFLHLIHLDKEEKVSDKSVINMSTFTKEMLEYFNVLSQEKGIKMESNIEEDIIIEGNKEKLEEAVSNVVSNAIKYMPPEEAIKKRKIFVKLYKNDSRACLEVSDTGAGIGKEDLPNIFSRFYRKNRSSEIGIPGTGLGLAITKKIIENHDGKVFVESKPHKKTTFTIELPLHAN